MAGRVTLQMDTGRVTVQNTFIHLLHDDAEVRDGLELKRSTSVPPSQRFGERRQSDACKEGAADSYAETDVSTEVSSDKGSLDASDTPLSSLSPATLSRPCTPCALDDESPYYQGSLPDWPTSSGNWTSATMPVILVPAPAPAAVDSFPAEQKALVSESAPKPTPLRLNSQAKAWVPNVATAAPVSKKATKEAQAVNRRISFVIESVKQVLMTCLMVSSVEVSEEPLGPTLTLRIKSEYSKRQNDILMLAKATLSTTVQKTDLHFMGSQADPFVPMPSGVAVKVCSVKDENKICWDLLRTGFCCYGAQCHWRHPKAEKRIAVKLQLEESS